MIKTASNTASTPMRVGLTGGIASGKSTVAEMFATLGVAVIDTDVIAREVVQPGEPALAEIRAEFGDQVILENGELDRTAMRHLVLPTHLRERNSKRFCTLGFGSPPFSKRQRLAASTS